MAISKKVAERLAQQLKRETVDGEEARQAQDYLKQAAKQAAKAKAKAAATAPLQSSLQPSPQQQESTII